MTKGFLFNQPIRICAQVDDSQVGIFLSYWFRYDKPCRLTLVPSEKSSGLIGICFTVKSDDYPTLEFMNHACKKTGANLWDLTNKQKI